MPQYDFSSYYLNEDLADVTIVIITSNFSRKSVKRQRCHDQGHHEELPGHGIVLANVSQFFKNEIERSQQRSDTKPQVELRVEPDQVAAARALIHFVYRGCLPDDTNQHLLVNALLLSDTYDTPACASACLASLLSIPLSRLEWQTVQQVFSLSGWQLQRPSFSLLAEQCLDRLQRDLGDLDAALSCNYMKRQLLELPYEGFVRLLGDARIQASYESTALVATHNWLLQHPDTTTEETATLASHLRLPHVQPLFLASVLPKMTWLLEVLTPGGLAMALGATRGVGDDSCCQLLQELVHGMPRAWLHGPRTCPQRFLVQGDEAPTEQAASPPELSFTWQVPLAALQELFETELQAVRGTQHRQHAQGHYHHHQQQQQLVLAAGDRDRMQQHQAEGPLAGGKPASPHQQQQQRWGTAGAFKAAAATAGAAAAAAAAAIRRVTIGAAAPGGAAASSGTAGGAAGPAQSNTTGAASGGGWGAAAAGGSPATGHPQQQQQHLGFLVGREGSSSRLAGGRGDHLPGVIAVGSDGEDDAGADGSAAPAGAVVKSSGGQSVHMLRSPSLVFAGHAWNMVLSITWQEQDGAGAARGAAAGDAAADEGDEVELVESQRQGGWVRPGGGVGGQGLVGRHVGFHGVEDRPSKGGRGKTSSRQDQRGQQGQLPGRVSRQGFAAGGGRGAAGDEEVEPWVKDEPLEHGAAAFGGGCSLNMARGAMHPPVAAAACSGGHSGRAGAGGFTTATASGGGGARVLHQGGISAGYQTPLAGAAAEPLSPEIEPLDKDGMQVTPAGRGSRAESKGHDGDRAGYGLHAHAAYTAPAKLRGRRAEATAAAVRGPAAGGEGLYGVRQGHEGAVAGQWVVGLALESAPAMPARGSAVIGFSASLAVKLAAGAGGAHGAARGATRRTKGVQQAAEPGGRGEGSDVRRGAAAAAGGAEGTTGGGGSRHLAGAGGHGRGVARKLTSRKPAAAAAGGGAAGGGSSRGLVGKHGQGGTSGAAGDDSDSGSSPSPMVEMVRRRQRRREISTSEGEEDIEQEESEACAAAGARGHGGAFRHGQGTAGGSPRGTVSGEMGAVAAGVAGEGGEEGWREQDLPAGTWLRSRGGNAGFVDFFEVALKQPGHWDAAAWQQYVQQDGKLHLRCIVRNVA